MRFDRLAAVAESEEGDGVVLVDVKARDGDADGHPVVGVPGAKQKAVLAMKRRGFLRGHQPVLPLLFVANQRANR